MSSSLDAHEGRPLTKSSPFTLLVNSCDAFEDCWDPFFTLLQRYWQGALPPILLNTEYKDYTFPDLPIETTRVQIGHPDRLSWSACLDSALAKVETPLVLYMQEDYFLERRVDIDVINRATRLMMEDPEIKHLGLTHFGSGGNLSSSSNQGFSTIGARAPYRISTQAGLWRVETLRSYLKPWESGWAFELFGTTRAWRRSETFLTVERGSSAPPIAYQHTGIVKGQWSDFIPALFEVESISVDLSKRGIHRDPGGFRRRVKLLRTIASQPKLALRSLLEK